jgi:hypothetical protein
LSELGDTENADRFTSPLIENMKRRISRRVCYLDYIQTVECAGDELQKLSREPGATRGRHLKKTELGIKKTCRSLLSSRQARTMIPEG